MRSLGDFLAGGIRFLSRKLFYAGAVFLFILVILITLEVVARRFLGRPTSWSFEISTYLLSLIIFLPIAYVLQIRRHIAVSFLYDHLSNKGRSVLDLVAPVLALVWSVILTWQIGKLAYASLQHGWTSGTQLSVPIGYLQLVMAIGASLLCLEFVLLILSHVKLLLGRRNPAPPGKEVSG